MNSIRPLLIRPHAKFKCHGDGLCCSDIHLLGPITRKEKRFLQVISPLTVVRDTDINEDVLRTKNDHHCVFLIDRLCQIHAQLAEIAKPDGCRRFPYGLVATPDGGRVTTEHRCPCRSLGESPKLTAEHATFALRDSAGRLSANARVEGKIRLKRDQKIAFSDFKAMEDTILEAIWSGASIEQTLKAKPFPKLKRKDWSKAADEIAADPDGTAFDEAMIWLAYAVHQWQGTHMPLPSARPWSAAFDRAQKRSKEKKPAHVLRDWLCDEIWSLDWIDRSTWPQARHDWVTRFVLAETLTRAFVKTGSRADRAAAEVSDGGRTRRRVAHVARPRQNLRRLKKNGVARAEWVARGDSGSAWVWPQRTSEGGPIASMGGAALLLSA